MAASRRAAGAARPLSAPGARVVAATLVALLIATPIDLAIEAAAKRIFSVSGDFPPFQGTVGPYTAGAIVLAGTAYWVVARIGLDVRRVYPWLAALVLLLSWIPDLALLVINEPGASVPAIGALMTMHALSAVIVTVLLLRVASPRVS